MAMRVTQVQATTEGGKVLLTLKADGPTFTGIDSVFELTADQAKEVAAVLGWAAISACEPETRTLPYTLLVDLV